MPTSVNEPFDPDTHISLQTTARLLTDDPNVSHPVPAYLAWTRNDPFAVTITFRPSPLTYVKWIFARELLPEGGGVGDVVVAWEDDGVHLLLSTRRHHPERHHASQWDDEGLDLVRTPDREEAEFVFETEWMNDILAALDKRMPIDDQPKVEDWTDDEWNAALEVLHNPPTRRN